MCKESRLHRARQQLPARLATGTPTAHTPRLPSTSRELDLRIRSRPARFKCPVKGRRIPPVDATRSCFSFSERYSSEGPRSVVLADWEVMDDGTMIPKDVELEFTQALHLAGENYREIVEIAATAPDRDEAIRRRPARQPQDRHYPRRDHRLDPRTPPLAA